MKEQIIHKIINGSEKLTLTLNTAVAEKLYDFLQLLQKWNKAYNLTAIDSMDKMLTHHLLDSLAVAPFLSAQRILDVGTGAGFPGIPLSLYFPEKEFTLLDSIGKKIRFLQQVKMQLGLGNVELVQARVEKFNTARRFDGIICRAVGNMAELIFASSHLMAPQGQWFFMKGTYPQQEVDELRTINQKHTIDVHQIQIPGVSADRHLVIVSSKEG